MLNELPPIFAFNLGPAEIGLLLVVIVLLFGANKIPELARSVGKAKGEYEKGKRELEQELRRAESTETAQRAGPTDDEEKEDPEEKARMGGLAQKRANGSE
ncbi:MAG: twin-arginine translocase TatA/TatE family subunit [Euryarchaeota archaeon]|nr:twin-arginine translocase TatA/TatE family subunit [Euryarchaeota archaeon]